MNVWVSHKQVHLVSFLYTYLTADKPDRLAEWAEQRHQKAGQGEWVVVRGRALNVNYFESG